MSSLTTPRGPHSPRVYWLRRVVVVLLAFGLVFAIGRLLGGGGGSPQRAAPAAAPTRSATKATHSPTPTPSATASPTSTTSSGAAQVQPDGPCKPDDVVVAGVPKPQIAGSEIRLPLKLSSTRPACSFKVSPETVVVKVTSGPARVWSSQDCPRAVPTEDVVLRTDQPVRVPIRWSGRISDSGCTRSTPWAQPGAYHVLAAALGSNPTDVQFELVKPGPRVVVKHRKPKPTPTPTPSPTTSGSAEQSSSAQQGDTTAHAQQQHDQQQHDQATAP